MHRMKKNLSICAAALVARPVFLRGGGPAEAPAGVCLTICNHWSYIGIGWQLGIESNVLSVTDAMELADRAPHAKTCINLDARAYELLAEIRQALWHQDLGLDILPLALVREEPRLNTQEFTVYAALYRTGEFQDF